PRRSRQLFTLCCERASRLTFARGSLFLIGQLFYCIDTRRRTKPRERARLKFKLRLGLPLGLLRPITVTHQGGTFLILLSRSGETSAQTHRKVAYQVRGR